MQKGPLFSISQQDILNEGQFTIPPPVGSGSIKTVFLNPGIRLALSDYELNQPTVLKYFPNAPFFGFGFCLSGESEVCTGCLNNAFSIKSGQSALYSFPTDVDFTETVGREHVVMKRSILIFSFHPEMVFFANLGVNLHICLCGDRQVASAQTLDFLDIGKKSSFPDWKLGSIRKSFPDGHYLISIRKWSFLPISASICTFACAATTRSPPRKRWISLILAKNPHFRIGNWVL